jgi:hypothetical protein
MIHDFNPTTNRCKICDLPLMETTNLLSCQSPEDKANQKKMKADLAALKERKDNFNPAVHHVLQYFKYEHLPGKLQAVSKLFETLASELAERSPQSPETTVALRKLLEAKDAAVRAAL